jgi:hypothetical protein
VSAFAICFYVIPNTCNTESNYGRETAAMPNISYCGLDCDDCTYRKDQNCVTCCKGAGTVWYGKCVVAKCVIDKKLNTCQDCPQYPCKDFLVTRNY